MPTTTSFYDQQASVFDQRVGLSLPRCKQVVATIEQLCGFNQQATLIEMGCGTGELGLLLAAQFDHYIGMDLSLAMLKQYKSHDQSDSIPLIQADGNATWPVANQQADIIFSSRAIHWIDPKHTVNEIYRIANKNHALFMVFREGLRQLIYRMLNRMIPFECYLQPRQDHASDRISFVRFNL